MSDTQFVFRKLAGTVRAVVDGVEKGVQLTKGDPIPEGILPDELEKLKRLGAVGRKGAVRVIDAVAPTVEAVQEAVPSAALDLSALSTVSDEALSAGIGSVGVKKLLEAVGSDAALASRVLAAEQTATKGDTRSSLVKGLEKVIAAGATQV